MPSVIRGGDNFDSQEAVSGTAKAWVNFNGTGTVAIRDSYNISSVTDNSTGNYTVNFTTAMPNANYCAQSVCDFDGVNMNVMMVTPLVLTTSSVQVLSRATAANTAYDQLQLWVSIFSN